MYDAFYPGQVWLDTNGNRIQAHGGSLIYLDGVYYWYGENKDADTTRRSVSFLGVCCDFREFLPRRHYERVGFRPPRLPRQAVDIYVQLMQ